MSNEEDEKKAKSLHITVDSKQMEQLATDLAKEKIKNEKLEDEKLKQGEDKPLLFNSDSDLATRKIQVWEKFHDERMLSAQTKEELTQMVTNLVNEVAVSRTKAPSGSAPLNSQQMGSDGQDDLYKHRFSNEKEMISTLLKLSRENDQNAKSYLDAMLQNYVKAKKQNPNVPDAYFDPNAPENLPLLKKEGQFLVPVDPKEGDIGKILEAWKQIRNAKREEGKA